MSSYMTGGTLDEHDLFTPPEKIGRHLEPRPPESAHDHMPAREPEPHEAELLAKEDDQRMRGRVCHHPRREEFGG